MVVRVAQEPQTVVEAVVGLVLVLGHLLLVAVQVVLA